MIAATALVEGKLGKSLKKVLKKIVAKEAHEQLAISDVKLGGVIKVGDTIIFYYLYTANKNNTSNCSCFFQEKLDLSCIHSPTVCELMRCIRSQVESLITGLPSREMAAMSLGLAHR